MKLTPTQKTFALSDRFYNNIEWKPKKGDYYTSTRADLELYQIVDEDKYFFYTNYCDTSQKTDKPAKWKKDEFLKDFGVNRVLVSDYIFEINHSL